MIEKTREQKLSEIENPSSENGLCTKRDFLRLGSLSLAAVATGCNIPLVEESERILTLKKMEEVWGTSEAPAYSISSGVKYHGPEVTYQRWLSESLTAVKLRLKELERLQHKTDEALQTRSSDHPKWARRDLESQLIGLLNEAYKAGKNTNLSESALPFEDSLGTITPKEQLALHQYKENYPQAFQLSFTIFKLLTKKDPPNIVKVVRIERDQISPSLSGDSNSITNVNRIVSNTYAREAVIGVHEFGHLANRYLEGVELTHPNINPFTLHNMAREQAGAYLFEHVGIRVVRDPHMRRLMYRDSGISKALQNYYLDQSDTNEFSLGQVLADATLSFYGDPAEAFLALSSVKPLGSSITELIASNIAKTAELNDLYVEVNTFSAQLVRRLLFAVFGEKA